MPAAKWNQVVRLLGFLRQRNGPGAGEADGQLLDRFVQKRDESAFELLLWRHGAMVLNVCRRLVRNDEDAEDAFQATFLALVKKARSIRRGEALAGWLYRVAYRAALEARTRSARVARHEKPAQPHTECAGYIEPGWNDLSPVLDEEIGRLPERFRLPLILCYLEGKTNEEAARQLGCPTGTVFSRLSKGRALLRTRLVRRGLALSAAGLATLLTQNAAAAGPVPALLAATLKAGMSAAAGRAAAVSSHVASLTEGVLKAMFIKKIKFAVGLFVVLAFLVAGGGGLLYHALQAGPPDQIDPPAIVAPPQTKSENEQNRAKTITVQVVSPEPGELRRTCTESASIAAFQSVDVIPQISGTLKFLAVDIGDRVKKDQVLGTIDAPDLLKDLKLAQIVLALAKAKVEQQEAKVETAKTEVLAAEAIVRARQAELASAKANQLYRKKILERIRQLENNKAVAREEVDEVMAKHEAALAATAAAEAALENARAETKQKLSRIRLAQTTLKLEQLQTQAAQVALEKAQVFVDYTQLRAPFDGVVTVRNLATGDVISAKNRQAVVKIIRTDRMRVIVNVPARDAVFIRPGMPVDLDIDALGNQKFPGLKVSRTASSISRQNGTMRVEVDVANTKGLLMEGMFGHASIKLGMVNNPKDLVIPRSCILERKRDSGVYVGKCGKARVVPVRFATSQGNRIEVLSGLSADDEVVLRPAGLKDGAAVEIKKSR
jgi:RND family efflux transporter MFP subunit